MRLFWWHRLPHGDYDVSQLKASLSFATAHILLVFVALGTIVLCPFWLSFFCCWGVFLQLYATDEPDVRIGLFRRHNPPEELTVGDNYATFFFHFVHAPLLLNALLALSLNRWLDSQDGPQ